MDRPTMVQNFLDAGAKPRLLKLLTHHDENIVTCALRAIRYLLKPKANPSEESTIARPTASFSPPQKKQPDQQWNLSPLLGNAYAIDAPGDMLKVDILTCRNVEMFKSVEDTEGNQEREFGAFFKGQIGIRCMHCGLSPFATAQFSTVYPGKFGYSIFNSVNTRWKNSYLYHFIHQSYSEYRKHCSHSSSHDKTSLHKLSKHSTQCKRMYLSSGIRYFATSKLLATSTILRRNL